MDRYAVGLVSEIDMMVWQRSDIGAAEVAWPAGLEVPKARISGWSKAIGTGAEWPNQAAPHSSSNTDRAGSPPPTGRFPRV